MFYLCFSVVVVRDTTFFLYTNQSCTTTDFRTQLKCFGFELSLKIYIWGDVAYIFLLLCSYSFCVLLLFIIIYMTYTQCIRLCVLLRARTLCVLRKSDNWARQSIGIMVVCMQRQQCCCVADKSKRMIMFRCCCTSVWQTKAMRSGERWKFLHAIRFDRMMMSLFVCFSPFLCYKYRDCRGLCEIIWHAFALWLYYCFCTHFVTRIQKLFTNFLL